MMIVTSINLERYQNDLKGDDLCFWAQGVTSKTQRIDAPKNGIIGQGTEFTPAREPSVEIGNVGAAYGSSVFKKRDFCYVGVEYEVKA